MAEFLQTDDDGETWITVNGAHVKIEDAGGSPASGGSGKSAPAKSGGRKKETPEEAQARSERVMGKLPAIDKAIPAIRSRIQKDLSKDDAQKERVAAAVAAIMDATTMRVGSEKYASKAIEEGSKSQASYGASSLRKSHVTVSGDTVTFTFPGKSRKQWNRSVTDPKLAAAIKHLQTLPGDKLMQYHAGDEIRPFTERHANEYLGEHGITAKNIRTYHATRMASDLLSKMGTPKTEAEAHAHIKKVTKAVSEHLGNTPAVAQAHYIHPAVFSHHVSKAASASSDATEEAHADHPYPIFSQYITQLQDLIRSGKITGEHPFPEDIKDVEDDEDGLAEGLEGYEQGDLHSKRGNQTSDSIGDFQTLGAVRDYQVLTDAVEGGLLRVRQLATIADRPNANKRRYPKRVLQDAINTCRGLATSGAMLGELIHPEVVRTRSGDDAFIDNPHRKATRVDEISDVATDGRVYATFTVLDTPCGRMLADSFLSGKPYGPSTRFRMTGHEEKSGRDSLTVADTMEIHTFDHVINPAVLETSREYQLLTDSIGADNLREQLGYPADRAQRAQRSERMNEKIMRALNRGYSLLAQGAAADQIASVRQSVADEISAAEIAGDDVVEATKKLIAFDADARSAGYSPTQEPIAGYRANGPAIKAIAGSQSGKPGDGSAWGVEIPPQSLQPQDQDMPGPNDKGNLHADRSGLTEEELNEWRAEKAERLRAKSDEEKKLGIKAAIDAARNTEILRKLSPDCQTYILDKIKATAPDAESVPVMVAAEVDSLGALLSKERLAGGGFIGQQGAAGQTVSDPGDPGKVYITREARPFMQDVDRILAAMDNHRRATTGFDARDPDVVALRKYNRERFVDPLIEETVKIRQQASNKESWLTAMDSMMDARDRAVADSIDRAAAVYDATTLSNMFNQPSISTALLIQAFQELEALQFVDPMGPGLDQGSGGFFNDPNESIGSVLRFPVEYITEPGGFGTWAGASYDAGLLTPEAAGIDEITVNTNWLTFAPLWRRIAAAPTRDVIKAMGGGPLNYPAVGRHLFHMAYRKQRTIDKALYDEMLQMSDEYGAVVVSAETANLTYNSVYAAAGSITVNLNTGKTATTAPVPGDSSVTYGANVIGAIRLQTSGNGASAPYCGTTITSAGLGGVVPVVAPRTKYDLSSAGQSTSSTVNPITFSTPATGMVQGYLDSGGQVQTLPGGGAAANFAVDYNNGVVVFTSGVSGITGASGVLSAPAFALSAYSYSTNYDQVNVNNPTLPSGVTIEQYLNVVLSQFDVTAALMGSTPRFVPPNMAIMSKKASSWITRSTIFYNLNSPAGTNLFPTPSSFMERTGIYGARINSPWRVGDTRILLGRRGGTKYAVSVPFEIRGPYPKYDATSPTALKVIAQDVYYGEEYSVIGTPQVTNQAGTVLNPIYRSILLR